MSKINQIVEKVLKVGCFVMAFLIFLFIPALGETSDLDSALIQAVKDAVGLTQLYNYFGSPPYNWNTRNDDSEYLHFDHEFALAGTEPGENLNAFSVALWLHAGSALYPVY